MSSPEVAVVLVNYRTAHHVAPALAAVCAAAGPLALEAIVVDSAAPDREAARDAARRSPLSPRFLELAENRGFGAAANAGAAVATAPRLLFLNPDARPPAGVLARLLPHLDGHADRGAVAPRLVGLDGRAQVGDAGERPGVLGALGHAFALSRLVPAAPRLFHPVRPRGGDRAGEEAVRVGWLSAAFLLVSTSAFRAVSGFDEQFFLFGEDVDLGRRLAAAGLSSWLVPSLAVVHEGGASYRQQGALSPLEGRWALGLREAHARSGASPLARRAFGLALASGLAARAALYGASALPGLGSAGRERLRKARALWAATRAALGPLE